MVYLAALKARSLSHTHIIKKDLRGFLYGKESKKAPSLLKSNANHSLTYKCAPPHDWGQIPSVAGCAFYMSLNDWLCKDRKIFAIDPPYMATDISTYRMDWKLTDYLDVLLVLKGHPFVYFTSGKSPILDFCRWMEEHPETGNPFKGAGMSTLTARMNYSSSYTDIMLYKETTEAA